MKANGLELKIIKSKVETKEIKNLKEALSIFNSTGYVVSYLDYKVLIGKVTPENLYFFNNETIEEKYIQRLRLFNQSRELLLWRENGELKSRLRIDEEGDDTYAIDACQMLWGTDKEELDEGWIKLFEQRGPELILPYEKVRIDNWKNRLFLKTRNYIQFHPETQQATYVDCRFIGFKDKQV